MKIINLDKNGNIIPDLSKITLPYDLSADIWEILNPGRKAKRKELTKCSSMKKTLFTS